MIVDVKSMYLGESKFEYSDKVNEAIIKLLPPIYVQKDSVLDVKKGFNPWCDVAVITPNKPTSTYEVKTTNKENGYIQVELSRADGKPSGLSMTKADYYVFLHKTFSRTKQIGKLRILKTDTLKKIVDFYIHKRTALIVRQPDENGPGSISLEIKFDVNSVTQWVNAKVLSSSYEDGWLMDIDTTAEGYFDLSKPLRKNTSLYK